MPTDVRHLNVVCISSTGLSFKLLQVVTLPCRQRYMNHIRFAVGFESHDDFCKQFNSLFASILPLNSFLCTYSSSSRPFSQRCNESRQ